MIVEKFKIIKSTDKSFVENNVNELLDQGWKLNGNLYAFASFIDEAGAVIDITYIQSLTLE